MASIILFDLPNRISNLAQDRYIKLQTHQEERMYNNMPLTGISVDHIGLGDFQAGNRSL